MRFLFTLEIKKEDVVKMWNYKWTVTLSIIGVLALIYPHGLRAQDMQDTQEMQNTQDAPDDTMDNQDTMDTQDTQGTQEDQDMQATQDDQDMQGVQENQDTQDEQGIADTKEPDFTYGALVSIAKDSVTISEYNLDTEEEVQQVYTLTKDSVLENFDNLSDLAAGDEVEIFYNLSGTDRMVTSIYRTEKTDMGDDATEGSDEAMPQQQP